MNRSYRSVWNEFFGAWVATSETTAVRGKKIRARLLVSSSSLAFTALMSSPALAAVFVVGPGSCNQPVGHTTWTCEMPLDNGAVARISGLPNDPIPLAPGMYQPDISVISNWIASNLGANAVVIGDMSSQAADDSVALGNGAKAGDKNSVALGNSSRTHAAVAIASDANLIAGTTLNFAGASNVLGVVSVGDSAVGTRQVVNVAPGELSATSTDAVNGSQLFAVAKGLNDRIDNVSINVGQGGGVSWINANVSTVAAPIATGATALAAGNAANASGAQSTALGNSATASGDNSVAVGYSASATGNAATALGQGAVAAGTGSVAVGSNSNDGGRANVVSVGAEGAERQISNVAPGTQGTDAVNVNQLNQFGSSLQHQIDVNRREANAGAAGAMAMAGMPQAYMPGKSMVAAGAATYRGETALAVGMSRISDSGRWVTKFTGSANSRGNVGVAAGVGYQW